MSEIKKSALLKLPTRKWDKESHYDSIYLIPTRRKHDSGWAVMAIIGIIGGKPKEIAAMSCDDISWEPTFSTAWGVMRTDCEYPSGILHFWGNGLTFSVGSALSSVSIKISKEPK